MSDEKNDVGISRDDFLKKYEHIQLRQSLERVEERVPEFWKILKEIESHYNQFIDEYKSKIGVIIEKISNEDMNNPVIHSIRYRIKGVDSLLVKIIQKSANVPKEPQGNPEVEKYRNISKDNYYKIITDLIGIRILIRYRYQWKNVHALIWKLFNSTNDEYVGDWIKDYKSDPATRYIVEKPKAYIKQECDRDTYEQIGKNIFDIRNSENHYASLHYIINVGGYYCEIQVRTIFDEAWCECNHDFVYKSNIEDKKDKYTLEKLSVILSQHTTAAESIVDLMCNLTTEAYSSSNSPEEEHDDNDDNTENKSLELYSAIEKRAKHLPQTESFIDSLLSN